MKYLFITNDIGFAENANSGIVWLISENLCRHAEVHVFSISTYVMQGLHTYRGLSVVSYGPQYAVKQALEQYRETHEVMILVKLLGKPKLWGGVLRVMSRKLFGEQYVYLESFFAAHKIARMNKHNRYDKIIAVCEPTISIHIASRLKHLPISIYQLDPYHTNKIKKKDEMRWRLYIETRAYRNAQEIYITSTIRDEYLNTSLAAFKNKLKVVEFPLIRQHTRVKIPSTSTIQFSDDKINCLFCGTLDMQYRNPTFVLDLARQL